jgi:hypothetical protein
LNYRPTNIALLNKPGHPQHLDFWFGDGYGSYYMFHYKQKTSTSYPELVRVFGGPPAAAAPAGGPGGAGAAKGKGGPGGPGAAKGGDAPAPLAAQGGAPAGAGAAKGNARPPAPIDSTNNPHGNWIDMRDANNPVLLVADRGNQRIVRYGLDDKPIEVLEGRGQFCHFQEHKDLIVVPDLGSKVHILKGKQLVSTFGGPQEGGKPNPNRTTQNRADFVPGQFVAPHGATFDKDGNIFVAEWVEIGRVTKLRRV